MKLIIDIPDRIHKINQNRTLNITDSEILEKAVRSGIPLDDDSERAEVQAYFDGEAYGWEQGRKALIEDAKAEIEKKYREVEFMDDFGSGYNYAISEALEALDNISKAEGGE